MNKSLNNIQFLYNISKVSNHPILCLQFCISLIYLFLFFRYKNYMVALVNKSLLPPKLNIPKIGEFLYFTQGMKYNIEMILFCKFTF